MPILEPPKTVADWEKVRDSILDHMGNPYCDHLMYMHLRHKLDKVDEKIEALKKDENQNGCSGP